MRITSLLENTTLREDMRVEHGLSLYIETGAHRILFDMGQTALFAENAKALGIDLAAVDLAVLSHGHYDHGGGLATFLGLNDHAKIYVHRDAFLPHYNGKEKYIGLAPALAEEERVVFVSGCHRIDETLLLDDCNDRLRRHPLLCGDLCERVGEEFFPEDFRHEQYLLITEGEKRVLISGCSHKGVRDIAAWFTPHALVGGFHFSKMPLDTALTEAARELAAMDTDFYTCHCTGEAQYNFMRQEMPRLQYLSCGETIYL